MMMKQTVIRWVYGNRGLSMLLGRIWLRFRRDASGVG